MAAELPKIISVDDHVVEPAARVGDAGSRSATADRGPKVERRGIGPMRHVGGGSYEQTFDDDGPKADCWVYEDLVYIHKRHVALARPAHAEGAPPASNGRASARSPAVAPLSSTSGSSPSALRARQSRAAEAVRENWLTLGALIDRSFGEET